MAALGPSVMWEDGVAVDVSGNLYVADAGDFVDGGLGKILKITPDGLVTTVAGNGRHTPFRTLRVSRSTASGTST